MLKINRLLLFCLLIPVAGLAQTPSSELESDFCTRTAAGVDWKIVKGLHLDAAYEFRTADSFSRIERHQLDLGVEWSPIKYFSLGGGYCYIAGFNSSGEYRPRHRVYMNLTGSYKFGEWKLSLRERLQMTHKSYDFNEYQQTRNLVELRSRLKLAYKGFVHLEPYAYVEMYNIFNGPSITEGYDENTGWNYTFNGYTDTYINRLRGSLGLVWNIDSHNSIDFRVLLDWCHEKDIDVSAKGKKLKSYCWEDQLRTSVGVGYIFAF